MVNTITAIKDLSTNKWVVRKELYPVMETKILFGFVRGENTDFLLKNLKFGVKIYRNTGEKESLINLSWPISERLSFEGKQNKSPYLIERDFKLDIDDSFKLTIYGGEGGLESTHESFFTIQKPEKPYPSWVWDGNEWKAPVGPHTYNTTPRIPGFPGSPKDKFIWDEDSKKWILDCDELDPKLALQRVDREIDPSNPVG